MEKFTIQKDGRGIAVGVLIGAFLVLWLGFDLLKFKTSGQAEALARQEAAQAVVNAQARICAAQARASKDADALNAKLKGTERYSRADVITKSGFATMVGEKDPASGVPQACADLLVVPEKTEPASTGKA